MDTLATRRQYMFINRLFKRFKNREGEMTNKGADWSFLKITIPKFEKNKALYENI